MRGIRDDIEKEHAFLGLCALLRLNPQVRHRAPVAAFATYLGAFGLLAAPFNSDTDPSPISNILQGAGNCFTALCEAIVSWHQVGCEGLHNELIQLMQASSGCAVVPCCCRCHRCRCPLLEWPKLKGAHCRACMPCVKDRLHVLLLCRATRRSWRRWGSGMPPWPASRRPCSRSSAPCASCDCGCKHRLAPQQDQAQQQLCEVASISSCGSTFLLRALPPKRTSHDNRHCPAVSHTNTIHHCQPSAISILASTANYTVIALIRSIRVAASAMNLFFGSQQQQTERRARAAASALALLRCWHAMALLIAGKLSFDGQTHCTLEGRCCSLDTTRAKT